LSGTAVFAARGLTKTYRMDETEIHALRASFRPLKFHGDQMKPICLFGFGAGGA
jgi:hypothetical protein